MFPKEIWFNPVWCLYDNISGEIILKHPWRKGITVLCPHCGKELSVFEYKAQCCGQIFKIGNSEIRQVQPHGYHDKKYGRGWQSLRPFYSR